MTAGSGLFTRQHAQRAHLLQGGGLAAEVKDVRDDLLAELAPMAAVAVEELTNLAATNTAGLLAATATSVAVQTITSFLSGAAGTDALAAQPRSIKFTTADGASGGDHSDDAPATATVTGVDVNGNVQTEDVALGQTDGATAETVKCYSELTSVVYSAGGGTGATVAIGIGTKCGFRKKLKARAGSSGLIREIIAGTVAEPAATIVAQEWTDPATNATTALKAATATTVAPQTILAAALLAQGKTDLALYPRNLTFTSGGADATHAPGSVVITGTDIDDAPLTETLSLSQSAGTDLGVKAFKTVTSVVYGAAGGTDATVAIGLGKKFGLSKTIKLRAGATKFIQEIAAGSVVTNGVIADGSTSPPHGTYAPNTAPDGSNDYAVYYEQVATAGSSVVGAATSAPNGSYTPQTAFNGSTDYTLYYEYDATAP